jgi:hypothetical protein
MGDRGYGGGGGYGGRDGGGGGGGYGGGGGRGGYGGGGGGDRGGGGRGGGGGREGTPERVNPFFVVDTGFVEPDKNVCFEFQRFGRCTKGDACRFTHTAATRGGGAGGAGGGAGCVRTHAHHAHTRSSRAGALTHHLATAGHPERRRRRTSRGFPTLENSCGALSRACHVAAVRAHVCAR